jgi:hypothetical protein
VDRKWISIYAYMHAADGWDGMRDIGQLGLGKPGSLVPCELSAFASAGGVWMGTLAAVRWVELGCAEMHPARWVYSADGWIEVGGWE